jgi:glycosidase
MVVRCVRGLPLFALVAAAMVACGSDNLESATSLDPPEDTFDPSAGGAGGGSTTGSMTGADTGDTGDDGPAGCDDANKRCPHDFSLPDDGYTSVEIIGDFSPEGWNAGVPMTLEGDTWRATFGLPWDTEVQYKFRIDGTTAIPDPGNPDRTDDGQGGENSVLAPATCEMPSCEPEVYGDFDWRDAVIYFTFVDRFENGDPSNDGGIGVPMGSDWQGGDWAGVTQRIESGYFTDLGINVLWISVPMDNANVSGIGTDGMDYSAYHGYWPTNLDATEEHFGTLAELQALVDTAHEADIKVIFDYAMNHVHASAPVYADHPEWFWPNDNGAGGNCVCGEGCGWEGAQAKRCWFTSYLPDFDFNEEAARDFSVSNAIQWIQDTGVDGYRLDAVKHIEDSWLLDLRARVTEEIEPESGRHFYMVGETFTGDQGLIAYYVNPDMLDGQFDFPLRMEMARTLLMRQGSMSDLAGFMDGNDDFYGAGIMSTFIGNHDIPRAIHLAEDTPLWDNQWADGKDRAWTNQPGLPSGASAFERLGTAFAILMTTPGAPLVYYGDEIGMAGAGDPDNRRFMQWDGWSAPQQALFDRIALLTRIRADHPATRRGERTTISSSTDTFAYTMTAPGDVLHVLVNRSDSAESVSSVPEGEYVDELGGGTFSGGSVMVPARSALVLAAAN